MDARDCVLWTCHFNPRLPLPEKGSRSSVISGASTSLRADEGGVPWPVTARNPIDRLDSAADE